MTKATVSISIERYAYPRVSKRVDVAATIVGDLAVHRPVYWWEGDEITPGTKGWTVTHVATGLGLGSALPTDPRDTLKRKPLVEWARRLQEECAEFFAAVRDEGLESERARQSRASVRLAGLRLSGEVLP